MALVTALVLIFGVISLFYLRRTVGNTIESTEAAAVKAQKENRPRDFAQLKEQADQLRSRMAARVPVKGALSFLDSRGTPHAMGIDVGRHRLSAFVAAGAVAGLYGVLWAYYVRLLAPEDFAFGTAIDGLVMAVVGGSTMWLGPLLGSGGAAASAMGLATTSLVGELTPGGADRIAGGVGPTEDEEVALDWASMEFGAD